MDKRKTGYFGIGCIGMKTHMNYGTLFRTAQILGADFIFLIGKRFKQQPSDTLKSWRHIPLFQYETFEDFQNNIPYNCPLVCIELSDEAVLLSDFQHPKQACYLLGAEDLGIPNKALENCNHIVKMPGEFSLNVSVAGSIVIYDRISKQVCNN
jgi:tRNA G18 (ribose-2'-O)-methylase SpoU